MSGVVDDGVDAMWCEAPHLLGHAVTVRDGLDAELAQEVVVHGARGAYHLRPARLRDLHGEVAYAAARAVDEHGLPGAQVRGVHERLRGGERGERQRCSLLERQALGHARELPRRRGGELGIPAPRAREPGHAEHAVAGREQRDPAAHLRHDSRHVPAEGERWRPGIRGRASPLPSLPVHRIHPGGMDLDEHLGGNRRWTLDINEPEHLRPAELGDLHRPHVAMKTFFNSV